MVIGEHAKVRPEVSRLKILTVALSAEPPSLMASVSSVPEETEAGATLRVCLGSRVGLGGGVLSGGAGGIGVAVAGIGVGVGGIGVGVAGRGVAVG